MVSNKKNKVRTGPEEAVSVREFKGVQSSLDKLRASLPPTPTYEDSVENIEMGMTLFDHNKVVQVPRETPALVAGMRAHHDRKVIGKDRIEPGTVGVLVTTGSTVENITLATSVPIAQHCNTYQGGSADSLDGAITYCGEFEAGELNGHAGYWVSGIAVAGPTRDNPLIGLSQPGTTTSGKYGHFFPVAPKVPASLVDMRTTAQSEGPPALGFWTLVRSGPPGETVTTTGMTNLEGNLTSQQFTELNDITIQTSGVFFQTLQPGLDRRYVEVCIDIRDASTGGGPQFHGLVCSSLLLARPNQLVKEADVDETYVDYSNCWNEWAGNDYNNSGTILGVSGLEYPFARMANFKEDFQTTLSELNEHNVSRDNDTGNFSVLQGNPDHRPLAKFALRFDKTPFVMIVSDLVRDSAGGPGMLKAKFRASLSFSSDSQRYTMLPAPLVSAFQYVFEIWVHMTRTFENKKHQEKVRKALRAVANTLFTKDNALRAGKLIAKAVPAALALL